MAMANAGVTIPELVVVLACVAITTALALPSYRDLLLRQRLNAAYVEFSSSLQMAREEALRRGNRVTLCASADGASCSAAAGWQQGWIVFDDAAGTGQPRGEPILVQEPLPQLSIVGNQPVQRYVSYTGQGWPRLQTGAWQMGSFDFCAPHVKGRRLTLSDSGRIREKEPSCQR
jgi:type IV fimbrial biogenesis protein FimT